MVSEEEADYSQFGPKTVLITKSRSSYHSRFREGRTRSIDSPKRVEDHESKRNTD